MKQKEKQIEEMLKCICQNCRYFMRCNDDTICNDERLSEVLKGKCLTWRIGESIYNAGYRKQSEGENISQMHPSDEFICEKCGLIIRECCRYEIDEDDGDEICYEFPYRFCPRCGMKVKGGEA